MEFLQDIRQRVGLNNRHELLVRVFGEVVTVPITLILRLILLLFNSTSWFEVVSGLFSSIKISGETLLEILVRKMCDALSTVREWPRRQVHSIEPGSNQHFADQYEIV